MTQPLESRYRRLFLTYPSEYRREHESEVLGTLLEAAGPDQRWPSPREAAALLAGGLRTRARLAEGNPRAMWAGALRLGALLLFGEMASLGMALPALGVVGLVGLLAVLRANYALALMSILLVFGLQLGMAHEPVPWLLMNAAAYELLVLSLLPLLVLPVRVAGRPWPWRLALPAVLGAAGVAAALALGQRFGVAAPVLGLSLVGVPELVILALTLIAGDPRLGVAGLMVAIPSFLGSLATSAGGPGQAIIPVYRFDLVSGTSLLVCLLGVAVTMISARRETLT